ncbi:MAG TPA: penicillin-binding protein activator, partial [Kofleriaceae bacterium]
MVLVVALGCAPRVQPSWVDHEAPGSTHVTRAPRVAASGQLDVTRLDAAHVDDYDEPTLRAALDAYGDRAPAARFALRAARLAHHRGDDREASGLVERAGRAADAATVRAELAALAAALAPSPKIDAGKIAVLLPLSGPYAAIGSELRIAIELAPASGARWQFLDTHGTTEGATAAVEAAHAQGAIGVLGPVGQREAVAAARAAALHGLPIALLAPADGADAAAGVFRVVASAGDEGRAVAQLAAQDSYPTVAVFAPRDDHAREAADAFVDEATRLGLQVTGNGSYDPTGGDVEPDVKAFLHLVPAQNPRLAAHLARHGRTGWTTFSPDIPYTMLYVPDRYDRAAIIAAYLPYYNVELRTT